MYIMKRHTLYSIKNTELVIRRSVHTISNIEI